jgi:hypothetical protein
VGRGHPAAHRRHPSRHQGPAPAAAALPRLPPLDRLVSRHPAQPQATPTGW